MRFQTEIFFLFVSPIEKKKGKQPHITFPCTVSKENARGKSIKDIFLNMTLIFEQDDRKFRWSLLEVLCHIVCMTGYGVICVTPN